MPAPLGGTPSLAALPCEEGGVVAPLADVPSLPICELGVPGWYWFDVSVTGAPVVVV
jgi:hypothetical protein